MKSSTPNNVNVSGPSLDNEPVALTRAMSLRDLKVLVLAPWNNGSTWELGRIISESVRAFDLLQPPRIRAPSKLVPFLDGWSTKLSEFYLPLLALFKRKNYDVIISWTTRSGVIYGLLNRLCRSRHAPQHVAVDFHIDLRRSDLPYRFRLALLRLSLSGMDVGFCTSTREEQIYADLFPSPTCRFRFLPMYYPAYFHHLPASKKDYVFSYGKSGRDFETLVQAAHGLETPIVILSPTFRPATALPSNVTILRNHVSQSELIGLIVSARLVVIPLGHSDFSVGQIALTEVMSLGCPLVLTRNFATVEYATDGKSALFFEPGDVTELSRKIRLLIDNPALATKLGDAARRQANEYSSRHAAVFLDTLRELAASRAFLPLSDRIK
jgi:glycosyltransferase involved in cell wall biosynthesis